MYACHSRNGVSCRNKRGIIKDSDVAIYLFSLHDGMGGGVMCSAWREWIKMHDYFISISLVQLERGK
jgi:hypothetical protein